MPLLWVCAWSLVLVIHGAVPYLLTPTMGQAVWSTGFSQSYANQSLWAIYATNFGAPEPAAIAFGLPGAWVTGLFLRLGLPPPDAYTAMVACWMTLAMVFAYALARQWAVKPGLAIWAAVCWMSMPIAWAHAGYSMLSIGIALLPMYFFFALKLFAQWADTEDRPEPNTTFWKLFYPLVCILAVFMDGYTFMFFAVGASFLAAWWWWKASAAVRKQLALKALPLHVLSLVGAYLLYGAFVGKAGYTAAPLEVFRGYGADLTFFGIPTHGMHWLWDSLGWTELRTERRFYGDRSVWITTFSLPLILAAIWASRRVLGVHKLTGGLLLVTVFGFYMALGPSLKLNSVKVPEDTNQINRLMPADLALAPTGSGLLSEHLPGFNNMRASYRWTALGVFGAWSLLVLASSTSANRRASRTAVALFSVVIVCNLPNLPKAWAENRLHRSMFFQLETDLVDDMRQVLSPGQRVAFLPWRNDFLVNYLAARLDIVSFNIGGDKNLESAQRFWPKVLREFPGETYDPLFASRVGRLLASKQADVVVLPYIDMLIAAHRWPDESLHKAEVHSVVEFLQGTSLFEVTHRDRYVAVRIAPKYQDWSTADLLAKVHSTQCALAPCKEPVHSADNSSSMKVYLLDGWSSPEDWGQWSDGDSSSVLLDVGASFAGDLELQINARGFLVEHRLVNQQVGVYLGDRNLGRLDFVFPADAESSVKSVLIPETMINRSMGGAAIVTFRYETPTSPAALGISDDDRRLALGLIGLELRQRLHPPPK